MVAEVVEETSDVDQRLTAEGTEPDTCSSHSPGSSGLPEDRLDQAVVELIRKHERVQEAIMCLVLSSRHIRWEL